MKDWRLAADKTLLLSKCSGNHPPFAESFVSKLLGFCSFIGVRIAEPDLWRWDVVERKQRSMCFESPIHRHVHGLVNTSNVMIQVAVISSSPSQGWSKNLTCCCNPKEGSLALSMKCPSPCSLCIYDLGCNDSETTVRLPRLLALVGSLKCLPPD